MGSFPDPAEKNFDQHLEKDFTSLTIELLKDFSGDEADLEILSPGDLQPLGLLLLLAFIFLGSLPPFLAQFAEQFPLLWR